MRNVSLKRVMLLSILMGTFFAAGVFAADGIKKVDAYLRSDVTVKLDGKTVELDNPPLIYEDSSYLPLKRLGDLLDADVVWEDKTKTIYVNKRIYTTQPVVDEASIYEEILLEDPLGYSVTYLGREYPLLSNIYNNITYYRLSDIQRMGIDTKGLRKAKEKLTAALYVRKDELIKVWKGQPAFGYPDDVIVAGEKDSKKMEVLRDFSPGAPTAIVPNYVADDEDKDYRRTVRYGVVYAIDALPQENEYEILVFDRKYYKYHVKLSKATVDKTVDGITKSQEVWFVSYYSSEDLEPDKD